MLLNLLIIAKQYAMYQCIGILVGNGMLLSRVALTVYTTLSLVRSESSKTVASDQTVNQTTH